MTTKENNQTAVEYISANNDHSKKNCRMQECLENLVTQFSKKEITIMGYLEGRSVLVAKKK